MHFKDSLKKSVLLNIILSVFVFWYFFIHIGLDSYYKKYFTPEETALNRSYYLSQVNAYSKLNSLIDPKVKHIVFAGDSLIEHFPIRELHSCDTILNRGIGMDTTVGLLSRLEKNIMNINISKIFIMIGHNDIKYRKVEKTIENIKKIICIVDADQKYIISVLPSTDQKTNNITIDINSKLKRLCGNLNVTYLDLFKFLADENSRAKKEYFYDGTHLTVDGYILVYKNILPYLTSN